MDKENMCYQGEKKGEGQIKGETNKYKLLCIK